MGIDIDDPAPFHLDDMPACPCASWPSARASHARLPITISRKEALLAELARDGYRRLGSGIHSDAKLAVPPSERLARAAETYIAFGQERPALFRLMFSRELVDLSKHEAAQEAASAALAELSAIIQAMAPATDPHELTLVAWSLVHGYTSLCIEAGLEGEDQRRQRAALFARSVEALTSVQ